MMYSILQEIYELIKSLSKSEKRYFKLFTQFQRGDKTYLKLFDIIEHQKEFDEKQITARFQKYHKATTLPVIKKYLFDQLIASLKSFGAYKDLDSDHTDLIETYKVLHYKGLHGQASRLMTKAKSITWADDAFIRHYYLLLLEYFQEISYPSDPKATRLKEIFAERKQTLKIIENYSWVGDIFSYQRILLRKHLYCRTKTQKQELTRLITPLLETNESAMLSRTALGMRNMALCDYYMAIGQPRKAIKTSRIYLELRRNAGSADKTEMQTMAEYAMHLNLCTRSQIYDSFEEHLSVYKSFVAKIRNKDKFAIAYERWFLYSLISYLHRGRFTEAVELIESEKEKIQKLSKLITKKTRISIWYFTAYLHYIHSSFKDALKLLHKIMIETDDEMEEYVFSKLLMMFIHYDLKHFDLLEYQVRSARRLMTRKESLYQCETILFEFFNNCSSADSRTEQKKQFEHLNKKVNLLFRHPHEKGFSFYFDIQAWIESKLQNKPFAKVISTKQVA